MNKNELVKNLKKEIQDIYLKINEFENSEQIHLIDIDLARSKVRNLYELLSKLKPYESYEAEYQQEELLTKPKQQEEKIEVRVEEKNILEKDNPVLEEKKEAIQENEKSVQEESKHEPEFVIESPKKEEKEIIEEKTNETEAIEKQEVSPEIVADKFHSKKFVHDNIAKKNVKKDVSAKMQTKPIKDINSAIGLNDKFIFIRELFGGDKDHYNETIQILNNFDTYKNAIDFLKENFEWEEDDTNFERLKELVQRKFS